MARLLTVVSVMALASGCAGMKWYTLPVSPSEGEQLVPALISISESMGLRSYRGPSGVVTELADETKVSWQDSADHRSFILLVMLADTVAENLREQAWQAAKAQADAIWERALASRKHVAGAMRPMVVQPVPLPAPYGSTSEVHVSVPGMSFSVNTSEPASAVTGWVAPMNSQPGCRSDADCGSIGFCRNRGDGYAVCMANGAPGAFCAAGNDCAVGLSCRATGSANTCQQ